MGAIVKLNTIHEYNMAVGVETLHPLVSVVDFSTLKSLKHGRKNFGFYCIFLKQLKCGELSYGRSTYDYQEGTIVSFAPGQVAEIEMQKNVRPKAHGILFHPDLIRGTVLGGEIKNYSFFSYEIREALHLSEEERSTVMDCFHKIEAELKHGIDRHSRRLICANIGLLLDYCMRFYERQLVTRSKANHDVLTRFEQLLDNYFSGTFAEQNGLPTVKYFADKICLSPNYFGDMVKKETGRTPQEHIQEKVIEMAKERMIGTEDTVSQIAYSLGFQYPQHFCRLFKKRVGCTPNGYRVQNNL